MPKRRLHARKASELRMKNLSKKGKKRTKASRGLIAWRVIKGIIFIVCLSFFLFYSIEFLRIYYKYSTKMKIEYTYPAEFEFPAVTFCNLNPVKRSKFCAEYPNLCESPENVTGVCKVNPFLCKNNSSNILIPKLGFLANDSREEVRQAMNEIYFKGNVTKEFWEEWAWSIKPNRIKYDQNALECKDISECFDDLSNDWEERLIENVVARKMKPVFIYTQWNYHLCFTENLLLNSTDEPQKINLRLLRQDVRIYELYIQRSEEMYVGEEPLILLSVHSPFVPVNPIFWGKRLTLGYKYNIYIRLGEEKLLPFPYETDCTFYEYMRSKSNHQGQRSQEMCKELCLLKLHKTSKGTTKPELRFAMLEYPLKLCFDTECGEMSTEDRKVLLQCQRDCKRSCRNLKYSTTVTEASQDSSQKRNRDIDSQKNRIQVFIFLEDRHVVVEKHVPLYDAGHLYSYIGGLMGCWLGVSIWAFAGIAENVFQRAITWMEKIKRYFDESSPARQKVFSIHRNNVLRIKNS